MITKGATALFLLFFYMSTVACSTFPFGSETIDSVNQTVATRDFSKIRFAVDSGLEIDEYDEKGYSPLMNALANGSDLKTVDFLLKSAADPSYHENIFQRTPQMVANN